MKLRRRYQLISKTKQAVIRRVKGGMERRKVKRVVPEYHYNIIDNSILLDPFKKYIVTPAIKFVPWKIPANIITIVSNIFLYWALFLAVSHKPEYTLDFPVIAAFIFMYILGDHLDGMQAKRTKTSSALGEFCDHYLDAFNNGIITFIILTMYNVTDPHLLTFIFFFSYISHSTVIYEQFKNKKIIFEVIGTLEVLFFAVAIVAIGVIGPFHTWATTPIALTYTPIELTFICTTTAGFGTMIRSWFRISEITKTFYLYLLCSVVLGVFSYLFLEAIEIFSLFTLYNGIYIGRIMKGYLADGKERYPNIVIPGILIALGLIYIVDKAVPGYIMRYIYIYMFMTILYIVYTVFRRLSKFWVWRNPSREDVAAMD